MAFSGVSNLRCALTRHARVAALLVVAGLSTTATAADDFDTYRIPKLPMIEPPANGGWIVTLGAQVQGSPNYVGSSALAAGGFPIFSIRRSDQPEEFSAPDDNLQVAIFGDRRYAVGLVGNLDFGRYKNTDPALTGLNKISWAPEAGVYGEYWPILDHLRLRGEVRYAFGAQGFVSVLGADYIQPYGNFTVNVGPRLQIADADYLTSYFGVTTSQALANGGVHPFKVGAGVQFAGIEAAVRYRFNKSWELGAFGQYDRLLGDAARSPITAKYGSADQFIFGITAKYSFRVN